MFTWPHGLESLTACGRRSRRFLRRVMHYSQVQLTTATRLPHPRMHAGLGIAAGLGLPTCAVPSTSRHFCPTSVPPPPWPLATGSGTGPGHWGEPRAQMGGRCWVNPGRNDSWSPVDIWKPNIAIVPLVELGAPGKVKVKLLMAGGWGGSNPD